MQAPAADARTTMVRAETTINTVVTIVIAGVLSWLIFRGETAIAPLDAPPRGIFGILPGTFNFTLLVTLALTLITRRRLRAGLFPRFGEQEGPRVGARLPANVVLRAITLAVAATIVCVPVGGGVVWAGVRGDILPATWSFAGMLLFFTVYFAALSLFVTPIILWRALRD